MDRISNWQLVHEFQGLAHVGLVKNLSCPEDAAVLIPVINPAATNDDDLALLCPACDAITVPGVDTMSQIRAVVNEHREDIT